MSENNLMHLLLIACICGCTDNALRRSHVVQPGETLWEIAQKYGIYLEKLIRVNPQIRNPDIIFPGQIIRVP